jgi:hypothetical protein
VLYPPGDPLDTGCVGRRVGIEAHFLCRPADKEIDIGGGAVGKRHRWGVAQKIPVDDRVKGHGADGEKRFQ